MFSGISCVWDKGESQAQGVALNDLSEWAIHLNLS